MMFDQLGESTSNHDPPHRHLEPPADTASANAPTNVDFNSILQELKSVGQVHQVEAEPLSHSNDTSKCSRDRGIDRKSIFASISFERGSRRGVILLGSGSEEQRNEVWLVFPEVQTRNRNDHQRKENEKGHARRRFLATDSDQDSWRFQWTDAHRLDLADETSTLSHVLLTHCSSDEQEDHCRVSRNVDDEPYLTVNEECPGTRLESRGQESSDEDDLATAISTDGYRYEKHSSLLHLRRTSADRGWEKNNGFTCER